MYLYPFCMLFTQAVVNVILDKKALPSPETDVVAETVREDVEARLRQIDSTLESTKQVSLVETV